MEERVLVRGALSVVEGRGVVRIDADLPAPVEDVWAALTRPERLAGWYGDVEGDLRVGGTYRAVLLPSGWDGFGVVLACDHGRRLVVEGAEPGKEAVRDEVELTPRANGATGLVLAKHGVPVEMIAAYGVGTQIHVENLIAHLAGRGPVDPDPYWTELLPRYEALEVGG